MNPRQLTVRALLEWEKGRIFSDEILHTVFEQERLSPLDRAFIMETFFGVLRNLSRLDFLVVQLREGQIDPGTRAILRLGLYQIFHMRTAAHAAVNETVELSGRARGLVNAVLRRALREQEALESALAQAPLAVRTSHPGFLVTRWQAAFGHEAAERLCAWNNQPAELHVRANELKVTPGELLRATPEAEPSVAHPLMIKVRTIPFSWIAHGLCYVQDPSTLLACDLLGPQPGERVLDACAAPGGKTSYLAQLMRNEGRIVACDIYESRLARLRENLQRLGVTNTEILMHDCMQAGPPLESASFDRILVDAPCSNTGVIRRRMDVRWRLSDEDFIRMPAQQLALVRRSATLLKPGGTLVYSTCSLETEENEGFVELALRAVPELRFLESRRTLPFVDSVDGAFAAKFRRV
ncbi:MAG: rRNA (cytosine967-C5)-methyltransferase [Chthoniobacter sp.]|jgi:16S rRNA (cytosine967-C5)-methyltransferase|nr:rRNA (cytosine967-C5)-methyltransferase [Chthoniobacter sp.]